jgi:uncharacterized RDD family membrane protein YckC
MDSQSSFRAGGGTPPMMPSGRSEAMAAPSNLASPGLRIVGGLIDVVILVVIYGISAIVFITSGLQAPILLAGLLSVVIDVAYFAYFWSSGGASIGMMPFGFKVRDVATGHYPTMGKAALRGLIWTLEFGFTIFIIGTIGWLWQVWDRQKQAIHDKIAGTVVTTS